MKGYVAVQAVMKWWGRALDHIDAETIRERRPAVSWRKPAESSGVEGVGGI